MERPVIERLMPVPTALPGRQLLRITENNFTFQKQIKLALTFLGHIVRAAQKMRLFPTHVVVARNVVCVTCVCVLGKNG